MNESADYVAVYENVWKDLIERSDGSLDLDQIQRELFDYRNLMWNVSRVYNVVTGCRFSKPNTAAEYVIEAVSDRRQQAINDTVEEIAKELDAEGMTDAAAIVRRYL